MTQQQRNTIATAIQRAHKRPPKSYLSYHSRMPWGKHKGKKLEDILQTDPQYLHWLMQTNSTLQWNVQLKTDVLTEMENRR